MKFFKYLAFLLPFLASNVKGAQAVEVEDIINITVVIDDYGNSFPIRIDKNATLQELGEKLTVNNFYNDYLKEKGNYEEKTGTLTALENSKTLESCGIVNGSVLKLKKVTEEEAYKLFEEKKLI